jgi:hypothetical protein
MDTPRNTLVACIVSLLDACLLEEYQERAAIIQFDGKLDRHEAEFHALLDLLHRHKLKLVVVE